MKFEEPPIVPELFCAFCGLDDEEAGPRTLERLFPRIDGVGRHIRVQHLHPRAAGEGFFCSYKGFLAFMGVRCISYVAGHVSMIRHSNVVTGRPHLLLGSRSF